MPRFIVLAGNQRIQRKHLLRRTEKKMLLYCTVFPQVIQEVFVASSLDGGDGGSLDGVKNQHVHLWQWRGRPRDA